MLNPVTSVYAVESLSPGDPGYTPPESRRLTALNDHERDYDVIAGVLQDPLHE